MCSRGNEMLSSQIPCRTKRASGEIWELNIGVFRRRWGSDFCRYLCLAAWAPFFTRSSTRVKLGQQLGRSFWRWCFFGGPSLLRLFGGLIGLSGIYIRQESENAEILVPATCSPGVRSNRPNCPNLSTVPKSPTPDYFSKTPSSPSNAWKHQSFIFTPRTR